MVVVVHHYQSGHCGHLHLFIACFVVVAGIIIRRRTNWRRPGETKGERTLKWTKGDEVRWMAGKRLSAQVAQSKSHR